MNLSKIKEFVICHLSFVIFVLVLVIFFWKSFFKGLLPIPADTIVGMYHPWRDVIWDSFTAGVPFKNFLITDPVRQQYPWRHLVIEVLKKLQLPLWNPYSFAGSPLLANFQTAVFYPLNFLFFVLPFNLAWGVLIFLQPLLAGIFLYLYLRQLGLKEVVCFWGALVFSFSGFFVAWLEWGTILHSALWLPLILLSIEKIIYHRCHSELGSGSMAWAFVLIFSLSSSFFAGHLQTSFYLVLFSLIYLSWRLFQFKGNRLKLIFLFSFCYFLFSIITAIQWLPTLQFIKLSARGVDQIPFNQPGWFIPWQNLVQFLAPDFFGNPTTLNYWGIFNYAEFVGYIGVIPLIFALHAIFGRQDRRTIFFATLFLVALSFALPTPWAKLPFKLRIPLVSTSQPTRLLFIVDFCLAILAALGLDWLLHCFYVLKHDNRCGSKKRFFYAFLFFGFLYGGLWLFISLAPRIWPNASWIANLAVSKRNLILPTGMMTAFFGLVLGYWLTRQIFRNQKLITNYLLPATLSAILLLTAFDLLRFGWKFTPFVKKDWIFPPTKITEFLQKQPGVFRFMTADKRIFPPNFSVVYRLHALAGYDPLYLRRYGELIAAMERGRPDISPPFGFNRIIVPTNYHSRLVDLLNVKYILSLTDLNSAKLKLVYQEGKIRVYENKNVFPRAFMVYDYRLAQNKQEAIDLLMDKNLDLSEVAILEEPLPRSGLAEGKNEVEIVDYQENKVIIEVKTDRPGILILTDSYYPGWKARVDGKQTKIYRANYHFRAIIVPEGDHTVVFEYNLHHLVF